MDARVKRIGFLGGAAVLAAPRVALAASLEGEIARAAASSTGTVGVYARTMAPGPPRVAYNADVVFPSASTIKLLILVTLYREVDRDPALLERRIAPRSSDYVGGSPLFDAAPAGTRFPIATIARAMIAQSDNTAANALISLLGFDAINETAHRFNLAHTQLRRHFLDFGAILHHSNNLTTARDMGTLLYAIERGWREGLRTVASPRTCRLMIDLLLQQEDRDKIARGLPRGVPLANKTGEITGVRNDVGIVDPYGDSPYIIAVLTKGLNDFSLGVRAIRRIARAVDGRLGGH
jgi:beta-lactamase class A